MTLNEDDASLPEATAIDLRDPKLEALFADIPLGTEELTAVDGVRAYQGTNYQQAGAIWYALAKDGNPRSQFHLGGMLVEGRLAEPDLEAAYIWLKRADAGGYEDSSDLLARVENQLDPATLARLNQIVQ